MKHFLLAFIVFLIWSVVGTWYYACKIKNLCEGETTEMLISEPPVLKGFVAEAQRSALEEFQTDSIKSGLYTYLNENQEKFLVIKSYFDGSIEEREVAEERSEILKSILVTYGINESRIKKVTEEKKGLFKSYGKTNLSFEFGFEDIADDDLEMIESSIKTKTLYSEFGSGEFIPDRTLIAYVQELKYYLNSHPDENVQVIGHTDNVGSAEVNLNLGLKRAENVKEYMVAQGIEASKISVKSEGEMRPIADNETEDGRKLNRRIEIKVN